MSQAIQKITQDGEIIDSKVTTLEDNGADYIGTLARAEIDMQVATAHAYPRPRARVIAEKIKDLVTLDEQAAEDAFYAVPRAGKTIRGASIRLAETVAQQWGNCRTYARVTQIDRVNKIVIAQGVYHDLESNALTLSEISRSIADKRGIIYNADMINIACNAACSIAKRNAILRGIPAAIWSPALEAAEKVVAGDVETLTARRDKVIKAFANYGVTQDQIYAALGIRSSEDFSLEHIPTLQGMFTAIKNGDATVEELFAASSTSAKPATSTYKLNELVAQQQSVPPVTKAELEAALKASREKPLEQKPEPSAKAETTAAPAPPTQEQASGAGAVDDSPAPDRMGEQEMLQGLEPSDVIMRYGAARQAGWDAHKAGGARKPPGELRAKGRENEVQAWYSGWDSYEQDH